MTKPYRRARLPLLVACAVALTAACSNGKAKEKGEDPAETATVPVEVQPLRRAEMVAVYSGTAPIEAHEEAEVVAKVGDYDAILPSITGTGYVTGTAQWTLDSYDPFPEGFTLSDIWAAQ